MNKKDLQNFFLNIERIKSIEGSSKKKPIKSEFLSRKNARRSIVLKKNLRKGCKIESKMLTTKRPGTGITPDNWKKVIGKKLNRNLLEDHILKWRDFE